MKTSLFCATIFLLSTAALGADLTINSVSDFTDFIASVNNGNYYYKKTVCLETDLDLSGKTIAPTGTLSSSFLGSFDGKGHVISNLVMSSTEQYTGLFGVTGGMEVRNLILDDTCSITSTSVQTSDVTLGGFVGYCITQYGPCSIENSVSMATLTYSGSAGSFAIGGIIGMASQYYYQVYLTNCANYGSIKDSGTVGGSYMGGIIGYGKGVNPSNCANFGAITFAGTPTQYYPTVGGIIGSASYSDFINCLNYGTIAFTNSGYNQGVGGIAGYAIYSSILNSYWSSAVTYCVNDGAGSDIEYSYSFNDNFVLSESVSIGYYSGTSLIDALNGFSDYYAIYEYSRWVLNKNGNDVAFKINNNEITLDSKIILLPNLANTDELWFDGWYTDSEHTIPLTVTEIDVTELYGGWGSSSKEFTITFETYEGTPVEPISATYGTTVDLPRRSTRDNCEVAWWENVFGELVDWEFIIPGYNITLYAAWLCDHITTTRDFVTFANYVNYGGDYSGSTVYLDSDIDLTGISWDPINDFNGTFDGQGHVISNLTISSSAQSTGLFGYTYGSVIRNLVLDDSCIVVSFFRQDTYETYVGGIVGLAGAEYMESTIENCVNMANVYFAGSVADNAMCLGGIAGYMAHFGNYYYLKNCANYGDVASYMGTSNFTYIGGIVGNIYGTYLQNNLNNGNVGLVDATSTTSLYVGGVVGLADTAYIGNCIASGDISITGAIGSKLVGSLAGVLYVSASLVNSHWTSDTGYDEVGFKYNDGTQYSATVENSNKVTSDSISDIMSALKSNTDTYSWNKWILNSNKEPVTFVVNNNIMLTVNPQIVLLHNLADNDERTFDGWYTDEDLTTGFTASEMTSATTLYGTFCKTSGYTVTFDVNGGDASSLTETSMSIGCNSVYGTLETPTRTGYTFNGWFTASTGGDKIEADNKFTSFKDHALYAQWTINEYKVSFDFGNSTTVDYTFKHGSTLTYPEDTEREGYTFDGWFTDSAFITSANGMTVTGAVTIYAKYVPIIYTVTFDLGNGTKVEGPFEYGSTITSPEGAERVGYTFDGWFTDSSFGTPADGMTVTGAVTIYGKYIIKTYTVTFDFGNGITTTESFNHSDVIICPSNTEREGYTFEGWFTDSTFNTPFEATTTATESVTIYAKYVAKAVSSSSNNSNEGNDSEGNNHGSFSVRASPLFVVLLILFIL